MSIEEGSGELNVSYVEQAVDVTLRAYLPDGLYRLEATKILSNGTKIEINVIVYDGNINLDKDAIENSVQQELDQGGGEIVYIVKVIILDEV